VLSALLTAVNARRANRSQPDLPTFADLRAIREAMADLGAPYSAPRVAVRAASANGAELRPRSGSGSVSERSASQPGSGAPDARVPAFALAPTPQPAAAAAPAFVPQRAACASPSPSREVPPVAPQRAMPPPPARAASLPPMQRALPPAAPRANALAVASRGTSPSPSASPAAGPRAPPQAAARPPPPRAAAAVPASAPLTYNEQAALMHGQSKFAGIPQLWLDFEEVQILPVSGVNIGAYVHNQNAFALKQRYFPQHTVRGEGLGAGDGTISDRRGGHRANRGAPSLPVLPSYHTAELLPSHPR